MHGRSRTATFFEVGRITSENAARKGDVISVSPVEKVSLRNHGVDESSTGRFSECP